MKRLLAYLVVALSLSIVSCDNEDNEVLTVSTNTVKMQNGESIIVYEDTLLNFISGDFQPEQSVPINPDDIGVLKGFSDIKMEKYGSRPSLASGLKRADWIVKKCIILEKIIIIRNLSNVWKMNTLLAMCQVQPIWDFGDIARWILRNIRFSGKCE